jgi:plastocyanin
MRRRRAGFAALLATAILLSACSDNGSNEQKKAIDQATPVVAATVRYTGTGFEPSSVTLKQGQSIVLVNGDMVDHRFRTTPATLDSGAQRAGEQVTWNFTTVGEYQVAADAAAQRLAVTVQPKP